MDIKRVEEKAKEMFGPEGLLCAESVLNTVSDEAGIISPLIPRIATGFCGGIARTRGMCGAVTGGVILRAFEEEYRSINCFDLTGCDLSKEEGRQAFVEKGMIEKCRKFTGRAASMVAKLINDEEGNEAKPKQSG